MNRVLINGRENGGVPADDRGLAYGDGVFRTFRAKRGALPGWTRQYARLASDCAALGLRCPEQDLLASEARRAAADIDEAVVKIIVTRGSGARGYAPGAGLAPGRIVSAGPAPNHPSEWTEGGVSIRLCRQRLSHQPRLAGVKHLNRLENVLARGEWTDAAIAEGLMLDAWDRLIEGTMSNLFLAIGDDLVTPELSRCGVAGVQRERVLELAVEKGWRPVVRDIALAELYDASEVFLVNSVIGCWPVAELDGQRWPAGPIAREVARELHAGED